MMATRRIALLIMLSLPLVAIAPSIQIDFPNGGEVLRGGSEIRVLWHSLGVEGDLAILLFKGGEQYAIIADATANTGVFLWRIPPALPDSGQYRLRLCSLRNLRVNDFSDRDFAIQK